MREVFKGDAPGRVHELVADDLSVGVEVDAAIVLPTVAHVLRAADFAIADSDVRDITDRVVLQSHRRFLRFVMMLMTSMTSSSSTSPTPTTRMGPPAHIPT